MKISFDLDDTIISTKFSLEKESLWSKIIRSERIRVGTISLFKQLREQKHEIYIYTTSYRSKIKIKLMFLSYGIPIDFVVNQQLHEKELRKEAKMFLNFHLNLTLIFTLMILLVYKWKAKNLALKQ
ncbi:hypothetical protein [Chryseobacterium sp. CBo1]|uniref:hypothetical protein n=1 Tax=Chryseobacterium sp. CBo1 TaxID=1869230 RepID=UPI001E30618B|nr:hypothetical protein [Chryseobacterium sp. CBo1]